MKYTNYIINGKFIDIKTFELMPKALLPLTIGAAFTGMAICIGALPFAVTYDSYRTMKLASIRFERKHHLAQNVMDNVEIVIDSKPVTFLIKNPIIEVHDFLKRVA